MRWQKIAVLITPPALQVAVQRGLGSFYNHANSCSISQPQRKESWLIFEEEEDESPPPSLLLLNPLSPLEYLCDMFLRLPFAALAVARVDERRGEWQEKQSHLRTDSDTERPRGWISVGWKWNGCLAQFYGPDK